MMTINYAVILVLTCVCTCLAMDGKGLADYLQRFAEDGMGVNELQAHYDSLSYTRSDVDGAALVDQLSENIGQTFGNLKEAAEKIKVAVQDQYVNFPSSLTGGMENCCNVAGSPNLKFQANISYDSSCWTVSPKSPQIKKFPNQYVETVMRTNYNGNRKLLWQYFGGEDGTSILYPKAKVSPTSCSSFDPRFRPYYAAAATPIAKDVVVLVDTSVSMHITDNKDRSRLKLAKEVATTILQTLNSNDRMAVLSFDPDPEKLKPTGCYADQLSLYTADNEGVLSEFVGNLNAISNSDINVGLEAAFHYFSNSSAPKQGEERYQVILVLSDGADSPSDKSPLDVIREKNAELGNRIHIMVYGIGNGIEEDTNAREMLRNISLQTNNDASAGATKIGFFEIIPIADAVRSKMRSYYSFFKSSNTEAVISDPFIDTFSSIGLLISVCRPAYDKTDRSILLGVACADVKLSDLFSEAAVFHEGDSSYVFIIDSKGRTLNHPLLPLSRTVKTSYTLLDIAYLERSQGTAGIIEAMKRREAGSQQVISSTRTTARGVVLTEGIVTRTVKSTYFYAPIANSDYSICVVVGDGAKIAEFPTQTRRPGVFVYHRRDIYDDSLKSCKNFKRRATIEHSIVKFNANAFTDIGKYLYIEENANTVDGYTKYFNGEISHTGFTTEVTNSVVISIKAEEIWKSKTDLSLYTIWRYFGTKDGFIRVFPGVQLTNDYDHEKRPWWRRAKSQREIMTMTTPYLDAWGAGLVVTLCRTIFVGRQEGIPHTEQDDVEGVLGYDIGLSYLERLINEIYPECETGNTCMLVDNSGFIIIHPDFVDPNIQESERVAAVENIHIVQKESDIARDLIARSVMGKRSCADFDNHKLQVTYRIQLNDGDIHIKGTNYDLWKLEDTNVFLIRKTKADVSFQCCTDIPMISSTAKMCSGTKFCDCLCHTPIPFDACLNINSRDGISATCIAKAPDSTSTKEPDSLSGLEDCYNPICDTRTKEEDCYSVSGCSWCVRDDSSPLSKPCCRGVDTCDFGKVLGGKRDVCPDTTTSTSVGPVTTTEGHPSSSKSDVAVVVGAVLGSAVVILSVVIIVILYRRCSRDTRHKPADDYLTAMPSVRDNSQVQGVVNQQYAGMHPRHYDGGSDTHSMPMQHNVTPNSYDAMPGSSNSSTSSGNNPSLQGNKTMAPNTIPIDKKL